MPLAGIVGGMFLVEGTEPLPGLLAGTESTAAPFGVGERVAVRAGAAEEELAVLIDPAHRTLQPS